MIRHYAAQGLDQGPGVDEDTRKHERSSRSRSRPAGDSETVLETRRDYLTSNETFGALERLDPTGPKAIDVYGTELGHIADGRRADAEGRFAVDANECSRDSSSPPVRKHRSHFVERAIRRNRHDQRTRTVATRHQKGSQWSPCERRGRTKVARQEAALDTRFAGA